MQLIAFQHLAFTYHLINGAVIIIVLMLKINSFLLDIHIMHIKQGISLPEVCNSNENESNTIPISSFKIAWETLATTEG